MQSYEFQKKGIQLLLLLAIHRHTNESVGIMISENVENFGRTLKSLNIRQVTCLGQRLATVTNLWPTFD